MKVLMENGKKRDIEYNALCHELGIEPCVHFVEVKDGEIGFSCGHHEECVFLLNAIRRCGYVPTRGLIEAVRHG